MKASRFPQFSIMIVDDDDNIIYIYLIAGGP